jgi:molybdenum cofactor synthesis domain-containing protein
MRSPTAALLLIGDEILSGRTKDRNLGYVADFLTALGIDLKEARLVPDVEEDIVAAVNALRARYDYVFTTGGIGPTHDDITADAVARAFGVPIDHDPRAVAILEAHYEPGMLNEARLRMARIPKGASLIDNPVSRAPGFRLGNVFVMAGVPKIMQAMLEELKGELERGAPMLSATVTAFIGEGDLAKPLKEIQERYPDVVIGSYPFEEQGRFGSNLVLRSRDSARLGAAQAEVAAMAEALKASGRVKVWS